MTLKLNKRDLHLLKLLDLDARQSNVQIAKNLRISKNVVNYNIHRLEKAGLIKGYKTIVDASKLGYFFFRVYIDFYERNVNVDHELINYLVKLPEAGMVARVVGDWDIMVGFYVKDIHQFQAMWYGVLEKFRSHIREYAISLVTEQNIFRRTYLSDEKKDLSGKAWTLGKGEPQKTDQKDLEILQILVKNARTPIKDIAMHTNMSSMAIIYRIKQLMKKKIILGFRADIDATKLGYHYYRINMDLDELKACKQLLSFCQMHSNIVRADKAISEFDFEFDMEIKDFDQFQEIIDQIKAEFPGTVRDYNHFKIIQYYKKVYLPTKQLFYESL